MKKNKFRHIENPDLVSGYGRILRKTDENVIIDFDETLRVDFDFQLHRIEQLVNEFNGFMPPNRISHYVLAFIHQGSGRKIIGPYSFEIGQNMGLIFPKKVIHSTNKWSLDTKGYMLSFNDNFFTGLNFPVSFLSLPSLFKLSQIPYRTFSKQISSKVISIFEDLLTYKQSNIRFKFQLFLLKLAELIFLYKSVFEDENPSEDSKFVLFDTFVDLVDNNFRKNKSVKFYAGKLLVHPNHLNFLVKKYSGYTAKTYILYRVILEARYMLTSTSMPVKEIAYDLGFTDYNYFTRQFKSVTNLTPLQYRTSVI